MIKLLNHKGLDEHGRSKKEGSYPFVSLLLFALLLLPTKLVAQSAPDDNLKISAVLEERLRQQIASGPLEAKRSALFEIRNLRVPAASLLAVPALADKDEIVRATAASSVVFMPGSDAAQVLSPLLRDRAEFVRREAAYALGKTDSDQAVVSLLNASRNEKVMEVRTAIAIALGELGGGLEHFISILQKAPDEDEEFLRRSAARGIGQVARKMNGLNTDVLTPKNFLPEKLKEIDPSKYPNRNFQQFANVVPMLIQVLSSNRESDDTRREAAFALGEIGDSKAVPILQAYAASADTYLAEIVREALLKLGRNGN